ncbi:MAG: hypothetical protein ACM3MI_02920 [Clostridiales bacterium]
MPNINFESISISYDLQRIAMGLILIGFIAMRVRMGKLNKYKLKIHDWLLTLTYLLLILSLPRMVNFAYFSIISHRISPLVLLHSIIGIVVVGIGFIFVINKGNIKIKRAWKVKRNMQVIAVLWTINFVLGVYIFASLIARFVANVPS